MISQFFVLSQRGDNIVFLDLQKGNAEIFFRKVKFWKEDGEGDAPPVFVGDALYAFRTALKDPDNVLQSWDPTSVNPCTWFHVTCNSDNQVTRLDLGNWKLSGSLVPQLGKLEYLEYL